LQQDALQLLSSVVVCDDRLCVDVVGNDKLDDDDNVDVIAVDRVDLPAHLGDAGGVLVVSVLDTEPEVVAEVVAGSTSTTRNTALPSNTLRTLSASQSPREEEVEEGKEEEEEEDPVKASQNALPNLRKTVWLAIAANIACCCSFSRSF